MSVEKHQKLVEKLLGNNKEDIEYNKQKAELEQDSIKTRYQLMQEKNAELHALQSFNLDNEDPSIIQQIAEDNENYFLKAKHAKVFLNESFRGKIPLYPRNIILAAATTGSGKSTICANLAYKAIMQGQRILIIVNEENPADVYNRITCLIKGWAYVDHGNFSTEQIRVFKEMTISLSERVTVVGDSRGDLHDLTTSIEGIQRVLNSVVEKDNKFDLIMIDYYQNIDKSISLPSLVDWQVQYKFCKFLDQYKNRSNAAIVVLAQKKSSKDKELPFREALEGRKTILNIATCALDITRDSENQRTSFEIVKSRFGETLGQTIYVGFKRGRYVEYTKEFKNDVEMNKVAKATQVVTGSIKLTNANGED